jgi:hypothetical protein
VVKCSREKSWGRGELSPRDCPRLYYATPRAHRGWRPRVCFRRSGQGENRRCFRSEHYLTQIHRELIENIVGFPLDRYAGNRPVDANPVRDNRSWDVWGDPCDSGVAVKGKTDDVFDQNITLHKYIVRFQCSKRVFPLTATPETDPWTPTPFGTIGHGMSGAILVIYSRSEHYLTQIHREISMFQKGFGNVNVPLEWRSTS